MSDETEVGIEDDLSPETDAMGAPDADLTEDADAAESLADGDDLGAGVDVRALDEDMSPKRRERQSAFMGVPIEVTVSIGRARPLVSDLVKLRRDSVLTLDSKIEDPVELFIGDRLIARGELQEMDDDTGQLGVRLTEVADLSGGV